MKALLLLLVVLAGVLLWRNRQSRPSRVAAEPEPSQTAAIKMVCCDLCGTHIPANEVVQGSSGRYCCTQHQQQAQT